METTVETMAAVRERLTRLRALPGDAIGAERIVENVEELLSDFERVEALHVSLGLRGELPFAAAQEALRRERLAFSSEVERLRRRLDVPPERRKETTRRLVRAEILARRAPLTTEAELEQIRAARGECVPA